MSWLPDIRTPDREIGRLSGIGTPETEVERYRTRARKMPPEQLIIILALMVLVSASLFSLVLLAIWY